VAAVGLGLFWVTDKGVDLARPFEGLASRDAEIEEWARKANSHPYEPPEDGVLSEDRLETFLAVRRDVHEVYERHKSELEELHQRVETGEALSPAELLAVGTRALRMYGDLRLAQVRALAEKGMSEREYYAIQTAVYVAAGVSKTAQETGKLPSEAVSEAATRIQRAIRVAARAAQGEGIPGADRLSEQTLAQIEKSVARVSASGAEKLRVPAANLELFHKHEAAIEKYAMHGLTLLGL